MGSTDTADTSFTLEGNHVQIDSLTGQFGALALRGTGTVNFDQQLNLRLHAGPLEKVQGKLGIVGDILVSASDALANYHVTGTISSPQISLEVGPKR